MYCHHIDKGNVSYEPLIDIRLRSSSFSCQEFSKKVEDYKRLVAEKDKIIQNLKGNQSNADEVWKSFQLLFIVSTFSLSSFCFRVTDVASKCSCILLQIL